MQSLLETNLLPKAEFAVACTSQNPKPQHRETGDPDIKPFHRYTKEQFLFLINDAPTEILKPPADTSQSGTDYSSHRSLNLPSHNSAPSYINTGAIDHSGNDVVIVDNRAAHRETIHKPKIKIPILLGVGIVGLILAACALPPKADCTIIPPDKHYSAVVLPVGSHGGDAISKDDYARTRINFNCVNSDNVRTADGYLPRTVIYDINFLSNGAETIHQNLLDLKASGQWPVIRIASKYTDTHDWQPFTQEEAETIGKNLALALNDINGFPIKPIIIWGNEPNFDGEWRGRANPKEYAQTFYKFMAGLDNGTNGTGRNFQVFMTPLSYSTFDNINGISADKFIRIFFSEYDSLLKTGTYKFKGGSQAGMLDGIAINLWEPDMASMNSASNSQMSTFIPYSGYFSALRIFATEYGATVDGKAFDNCLDPAAWTRLNTPLIRGYLDKGLQKLPNVLGVTAGCFGKDDNGQGKVFPAIIPLNGQDPFLDGH